MTLRLSQFARVVLIFDEDDELIVSIPERDGPMHDYTFSMQPNDVALKPIRARCFDF